MKHKQINERHLEVHLTHHCNLNCVGCSHFSPSADVWFSDVDVYRKDMQRVKDIGILDIFKYIHLMGGEPMMHKDVNQFIEVTRQMFPEKEIVLSTNGILLPFNDEQEDKKGFWKESAKHDVKVFLSWYPPLTADKVEQIKVMARKHSVCLRIKDKPEMRGPGFKLSGGFNPKENFDKCPVSVCTNLLEGKLYTCAPLAYAFIFNKKYNQNLPEKGGINIYQDLTKDEFIKKLNRPVKLCGYCIITPEQFSQRTKWYQSGGKMEEYVREL